MLASKHEDAYHRRLLQEEFESRKIRNPRFSLRAFARALGLNPGGLFQLMSGARKLHPRMALQISDRLKLSPTETRLLLECSGLNLPTLDESLYAKEIKVETAVEERQFHHISEWYYSAVMSLSLVTQNRAEPKWIARRLGITDAQAAEALNRLIEMGLLQIRGKGFRQRTQHMATASGVPSVAIRKHHHQNLRIAARKLEKVDLEHRDFSSITLAMHPKKIESAKKLIQRFRRKFAAELESGRKTEVFNLCIQFFPVTELDQG